jgi:hypothetical protein
MKASTLICFIAATIIFPKEILDLPELSTPPLSVKVFIIGHAGEAMVVDR